LALTLPTSGGRSVGIVRPRTKTTELLLLLLWERSYFASLSCLNPQSDSSRQSLICEDSRHSSNGELQICETAYIRKVE
jgi:hypothetical protein